MISILMYHGIHSGPDDDGAFDPVYSVTPERYARQLDEIVAATDRVALLAATMPQPAPGKTAVITFDDGDLSNATRALGPLCDRGLTAEFFVTTDRIGDAHSMSEAQLRELVACGMSVQSHGKTHRYLSDVSATELREELVASKARLEDITGTPVESIALPGGRGGVRVRRMAAEVGYRWVCGSRLGVNEAGADPHDLKRVAVTSGMNDAEFRSLMLGSGVAYWQRRLRQGGLDALKKVLGNDRYDRLRSRWV